MRERFLSGLDYLAAVTRLCRRLRAAHPTLGLYEAADFQWWWSEPRPTDTMPQLFWFDNDSEPVAATIITGWGDSVALDVIVMLDAAPDRVKRVVDRGLEHARKSGFEELSVVIDSSDAVMAELLAERGFTDRTPEMAESWINADSAPEIGRLRDGYRLATRAETAATPHHMTPRRGADVEKRLRQTSLYRPGLDLVVFDRGGERAAAGLFWYDPLLRNGMVEPMRTEDGHRRRGLARHVLTTGLNLLVEAGAERIKICYEPGNEPAKRLYLGVGFEPVKQCVSLTRPQ